MPLRAREDIACSLRKGEKEGTNPSERLGFKQYVGNLHACVGDTHVGDQGVVQLPLMVAEP